MASEKARLAKEKGNAAFKSGDYPTAVGHYANAILADGSDYTLFLNRAAAYLKLNKNEDAERDCTKVLALNPNNVKALFRRGQARRALGRLDDAQADLDTALTLEPANESVKNEILELQKISNQERHKQRSKLITDHTPRVTTPKRRRVPIKIVEANIRPFSETQIAAPLETADLLRPVSSRPLGPESESTTTQVPPSRPQTFMDAKQAREESKPTRVSGGIFRRTGNHTIVSRTSHETRSSSREFTTQPIQSDARTSHPPKSSTTLFQFTRSWDSLQSNTDKWNLIRVSYHRAVQCCTNLQTFQDAYVTRFIQSIPSSVIPTLFQVSLEPELLGSILHIFQAVLEQDPTPSTRDAVRDYLSALTKVQRFGTVMLFMDKQERQLFERLHKRVNFTQS